MLNINKISVLVPYSTEWFSHRLGYMTGSRIHCICGLKGIGDGGMTYIRNKVYEKITGKSSERNINTEATIHGTFNEPFSLQEYQRNHDIPMIITDKHIVYDSIFSVTPDGLLIRDLKFIDNEKGEYNCETIESKSFMTPSTHMQHVECKTPYDIKTINSPLYWQVISQMYFCNVLRGNAIFFHPDFPETSKYRSGHVQFRKVEMKTEFDFFAGRLEEARTIYNSKLEFSKNN